MTAGVPVARIALIGAFLVVGLDAAAREPEPAATLGSLPVSYEGRSMPLESAADLIVYRLSGRARVDGGTASEWLVRLLLDPFRAVEDPVFLVDDPAALTAIGMTGAVRGRYSYLDLYPGLDSLNTFAVSLAAISRPLDATEREILALANSVKLFEGLASTFDIFRGGTAPADSDRLVELPGMLRVVPVTVDGAIRWVTPIAALDVARREGPDAPDSAAHIVRLLDAWRELHDAVSADDEGGPASERSAAAARSLAAEIDSLRAEDFRLGPTRVETLYNRLRPTVWAAWVALVGGVVGAVFGRTRRSVVPARTIAAVVLLLITMHQVMRFAITGRPPVTDLPSSFVFVAWLLSAAGAWLTFGPADRARSGLVLTSIPVAVLLFLAHLVTGASDRFGVVQAVLDTNLWLSTHVLIITAGYAGVIAAGVFGHIYLVQRIARPHRGELHQSSFRTMFTLSLIGLALTFLGTILGGVWADQSWGRFWGWDPKENGALMIVLWISIALHGRITRWFDRSAFAALTAFGVAVVFFSWLGVNLMGVGLHSYGFNPLSYWILIAVVLGEALFAATGWLLARNDRSARGLSRLLVRDLSWDADARIITLSTPTAAVEPGRYLGIRPEGFPRAKPFSVLDTGDGRVRLLVKGDGPVSEYLVNRLRTGETLWASPPSGGFTFDTPTSIPVVMLAGGVGIAPIVALARASLESGNPTHLIRAGRVHLYQQDAVEALRARFPSLAVVDVLSRPGVAGGAPAERVSPELLRGIAPHRPIPERAEWYVCGSPDFVVNGEQTAAAFSARAVHAEVFTPAVDPPSPPTVRTHVRIAGVDVEVLPGQTILDAALAAGVPVPYSCMSGTCGECECRLRSGAVAQAVSPARAGPGDRVLACVAYPDAADIPEIE